MAFFMVNIVDFVSDHFIRKLNIWYYLFTNTEDVLPILFDQKFILSFVVIIILASLSFYCKKQLNEEVTMDSYYLTGVMLIIYYLPKVVESLVEWVYYLTVAINPDKAVIIKSQGIFYLIIVLIAVTLMDKARKVLEDDKKRYLIFVSIVPMNVVLWFSLLLNIFNGQLRNFIILFDQQAGANHIVSYFQLAMIVLTIVALSVIKISSLRNIERYVRTKDVFICLGLVLLISSGSVFLVNISDWLLWFKKSFAIIERINYDLLFTFKHYDTFRLYMTSNLDSFYYLVDFVASMAIIIIYAMQIIVGLNRLYESNLISESKLYYRSI